MNLHRYIDNREMFLFAFIHVRVYATKVSLFPNGIERNAVFINFQCVFKQHLLTKGSVTRNIPSHAGYQSLLKLSTQYPPPSHFTHICMSHHTVFGPITRMLSAPSPAPLRMLCGGEICWIVIL